MPPESPRQRGSIPPPAIASLDSKLESENEVLEALVFGLAKNALQPDLWAKLHDAAQRDNRMSELAFAYESFVQDRRVKSLPPAANAEFMYNASNFFTAFGDELGAMAYLQRALTAYPAHLGAFERLESKLIARRDYKGLAELYINTAQHRGRVDQAQLLRRAVHMLEQSKGPSDRIIELLQQVLRLDAPDETSRLKLVEYFAALGRSREEVRLLEQGLNLEPEPTPEGARRMRTRLIELFAYELQEVEKSTPHVEALLALDPESETARNVAERLLEIRGVAARAASALADAHEASGKPQDVARYLSIELEHTRGTRRMAVLRRLGILLQDRIGNKIGAFDAIEQALTLDPAGDTLRERYVALAVALGRQLDAAKTLAKVAVTAKDAPVRARITADIGQLFAAGGDRKRARAVYASVLATPGVPDDAALRAARALTDIYEADGDLRELGAVLERRAELETDEGLLRASLEKWAELAMGPLEDPARAIVAWRKLLGLEQAAGASRERALESLERLYLDAGEVTELAWVMGERAVTAPPREARSLMIRAAEALTAVASSLSGPGQAATEAQGRAIAAWRRLIERFGPSRDVYASFIPLLEEIGDWPELAQALEADAALVPESDRGATLAKAGLVRLQRLRDVPGAIDSFRRALASDAGEKTAREALEKLLAAGDYRVAAAQALEPLYRAEESIAGLLRVLEVRATLGAHPEDRLSALDEAAQAAELSTTHRAQAIEYAGRGLLEAVQSGHPLEAWVERVQTLAGDGEAKRRATIFGRALGDRIVDSQSMLLLARHAGDALAEIGDVQGALGLLRRALEYDPSATEIVRRVDGLLRDQGNPHERLVLYRAALERERDASQQRRLLHGIGAIARHELKDPDGAIRAYKSALDLEAEDRDAYAALCELYEEVGEWAALIDLLEMRLGQLDGGPDSMRVRAQLAETAAVHEQPERATLHARALLGEPALTATELDSVERVAEVLGDANLSSEAFERRASSAGDPRDAIAALGRLGAARKGQGNVPAAVDAWKRAARVAKGSNEPESAQRFYELARKAAPLDAEANAELALLLEAEERWSALPELYAVLVDAAKSTDARCAVLLRLARVLADRLGDPSGAADAVARAFALDPSHAETLALFERLSVQSGEIAGFVRAVDSAMQEAKGASAKALRAELLLSKARVLSKDPQRQDDAAETYRALLADDADGDTARRTAAVGAFAKWLEAGDASPARNLDRRWLLAWRADHAERDEKIGHLVTWARAEETLFSDVEAALEVHRRVLALDPENTEASAAVARLTLATGDVGGAITALFAQRERSDGAARRAIDIEIATILIERGTQLDEALRCVAALLEEAPDDAEALGLAGRLLRLPKVGQEAAALLEKASHRVEDSDVRANIVNTLLEGPPEVAGTTTRRAWFERLIASHDAQGRKDAAFLTTLRAAEEFPLEASFWDRAEDLAREMQNPGSLADLYYRVLGGVLSPDGALEIGQRAVAFHEEWFDDPSRVIALLERVLTIDPTAAWAFDRLKLLFDSREQWDDLFALYDRAIETAARDRQVELLEDAAQIAKDFANHSDRAILYLEKLLALKPQNARITASLERLYERYGKHRELIGLLNGQLSAMNPAEARATRIRIAGMQLDHLDDVAGALTVVEGILGAEANGSASLPEAGDARAAERLKLVELLERILQAASGLQVGAGPGESGTSAGTTAKARQHAASLLKEHYVEAGRDADLARVLEVELEAVEDPKELVAGHKEIAAIYGKLGRDANALEHYVALVLLEPEVAEHRDRLTALAERVDQFDRAAEVLAKAAEQTKDEALRVELLMRAATMHEDKLGDGERAIALYLQVLALPGAGNETQLAATRRLDPLLLIASRPSDRLTVLERMSALETDPRARRIALGTAAELAAELGEDERAISAYGARLAHDDTDAGALDGLIVLLERGKRWRPLIDALTRRAAITPAKEQKRADRVALARIHRQELEEPDEAIAIWRAIEEDFGPSEEGTRALAGLLHGVARWTDLAQLLESSAKRAQDPEVRATFLRQLGDVLRERLDDHPRAIANYRAALEASPREPGALDGLYELVDSGKTAESRAEAVRVLYGAHTTAGEWQSALDLTEHRLTAAETNEERGRILKEAAWLGEHRIADRVIAYGFVGRAFLLAPHDLELKTDLFRLAEATSGWKAFVETHRRVLEAAEAATVRDAELLGRLHQHLGEALERRLDDAEGALAAYAKAVEITPHDTDAVRAVLRVAGPNMRWDAAARAAVLHAIATHSLDESLWTTLESVATTPAAWDAATVSLTRNIAGSPNLVAHLARDLEARVATWHRDRRGDPEAAEAALARALVHDPLNPALLASLANLQRRAKGRPLVESLLRLSEATGGDLELLREAAEIANDSIADRALGKSILERLMKLATERWFGREPPRDVTSGTPADPEQFVRWTIAALSRIYDEEGDAAKTVDLLVLASELPFDSDNRRTMRHQAAKIAVDKLGDRERAIALFQALFAEDPSDHAAAASLAELFQQQGRHADLLELREKQLAAAPHPALRLEVARLKVLLGRPEDAVATLQANLKDEPRHDETVRVLVDVYQRASRHADLTALLADQAALAEAGGDNEAASLFWARAAAVAEEKLDDANAAINYHARVVAIEPRAASYDALARLSMRRQDWTEAAQYLVLLRDHVDPDERAQVTLRLADALVSAGREDLARERLESAVAEEPREEKLRAHLGAIYQRTREYAPLAALLATGAAYADSNEVKLLRLREAADLYWHKCNMPAEAVPLLEQAAELDPENRAIRLLLADTLGAAGRIQEGRALLRAAIEAFGGRRPKERAPIHYHLARLDLLAGDRAPALAELEAATRIDPANAEILRTLAELARDDGELDRAERSYRALLAVVRRQDQPEESTPIVRTEVLLELSEIARRQGQTDRADEILESALEAATLHPVEASRLERALRARESWKALAKALEMKLERADRDAREGRDTREGGDAREGEPREDTGAERKAAILFELADVLGNKLGREDEAFGIGLRAIEAAPDSPSAHDAMLELAKRTHAVPRYVDTLARLAKAAAAKDKKLAGALYLRLGGIASSELEDDARALFMYEEAEQLESDSRDVLRALESLYGRAGKREGQERVLARLVELEAAAQPPNPAQHGGALSRLAALRLSTPGGVEAATDLLASALALDSENVHALSVLEKAIDAHPDRLKLLDLYEQTGRRPGQERLLLDALQRRSRRPDTPTSVLREAVSLAQSLGEKALVEELLGRYVSLARANEEEREHAAWALTLLAECAEARNELRDGLTLRLEAADYADPEEARKVRMFVARTAADRLGDPYFAAKVYERLFEQRPDDRTVWEPLGALYRKVGDSERLARLLGQVTDTIDEIEPRNEMRLERARILLTGGDAAKADAVFELRRILEEQPGHEEAGAMLLGILETNGREDELTELLNQQIDAAKDRGDSRRVATLSARLGVLVERQDPQAAIGIYYSALDWDPKSEPVLRAISRLLAQSGEPADRAELLERLIPLTSGPEAEKLTLELVSLREELWDTEGGERAIAVGFKACPESTTLRDRLLHIYRERGDTQKLAEVQVLDAMAQSEPAERAARLRKTATLYRTELRDAARAAELLQEARTSLPDDRELFDEHIATLTDAGLYQAAATELTSAASALPDQDARRAPLLAARASLRARLGDQGGALYDLERAFALDPANYVEPLTMQLARLREEAIRADDTAKEAAILLRLVNLLAKSGHTDAARMHLGELLTRDPNHREALRTLGELEETLGHWDVASATYRRLAMIDDSELSELALKLAHTSERAGELGFARPVLERALRSDPTNTEVRERLRELYARTGAHRELAEMSLAEARTTLDDDLRFTHLVRGAAVLLESGIEEQAALAALEEARTIRPNDIECAAFLADALLALGRPDEANALMHTTLAAQKGRRSRDLALLHQRLARVARTVGDRQGELSWLSSALDMDGQNGLVASELARSALELRQYDVATKALRTITMLRGSAPIPRAVAYQRLGEIAHVQGDTKKALLLLKRAVDDDPTLEDARALLHALSR
ncbi:tetratricopeptide repeat protein [Pendulispora albinea]|uniref:Tetratricopeptide repeat protein n=1 Tax=Pendulispora albinea TaxID=2741071 RepID=A0ABZ2LWD8_9BACT